MCYLIRKRGAEAADEIQAVDLLTLEKESLCAFCVSQR